MLPRGMISAVDVDDAVRGQFEQHLASFYSGHPREARTLGRGPIEDRLRGFHVEVFHPGPRHTGWSYVTCGAASVRDTTPHRLEFLVLGGRDDLSWLELATMAAYYHAGPDVQRFGLGHMVPLGEPIRPGAACDQLLLSLPYPLGPSFERCALSDGTHVQVLWVLPITAAEKTFMKEHGLEELEARFEKAGLNYLDPNRRSILWRAK